MNTDARVDQYLAKAPDFARPILTEVRARVRRACPEASETIKWNVPFYVLGGKLLASMAAFKEHTKIGVWTGMKPNMRDVTELSELPAAKLFEQELKAAAATVGSTNAKSAMKIGKKALAKKTATKNTIAKNATAKKTVAKKTDIKNTVVKKAVRKPKKV
jgi:uncharacterized protein YdhG (YjbR/CyaY superfamily)